MKEIRCDYCKVIIKDNDPRYKATVERLRNEEGSHIGSIVWKSMDFCNAQCLSNFIIKSAPNES